MERNALRISTFTRFRSVNFDSNVYSCHANNSLSLSLCLSVFFLFRICFYHIGVAQIFPVPKKRSSSNDFDRKKYLVRNFLASRQKFLPNFQRRVHFRPLHRYLPASLVPIFRGDVQDYRAFAYINLQTSHSREN